MTTDITELAQRMKAAAERVIKNYDSEWFETGSQICTVHKSKINLISLANPVNVLALVEALEKAQQQIVELQQGCENDPRIHEIIDLKERIAELESRTVTVKLPQRYSMLFREGFSEDYRTEIAYSAEDIQEMLTAAGIKWEAE